MRGISVGNVTPSISNNFFSSLVRTRSFDCNNQNKGIKLTKITLVFFQEITLHCTRLVTSLQNEKPFSVQAS